MHSKGNFYRIALVAWLGLSSPSIAQDTAFVRVLKSSANEMQMRDGHLRGAGADSLAAEARANQFILVGEDHGIREVPEFVGALFELAEACGLFPSGRRGWANNRSDARGHNARAVGAA
jgi:hypothetical protein